MIRDEETNVVYLADKLQDDYPDFWRRFIALLNEMDICWKLIPGTCDIWARDFMPIQLSDGEFLRYRYERRLCYYNKPRHCMRVIGNKMSRK